MASSPINIGIVGCDGISRLYTSIYAGLADIANVVAMADLDEGLAGARRRAMAQSYTVEAARSRSLALDARDEKTRSRHAALADAAEASAVDVRTYRGYQELLADGEVEAIDPERRTVRVARAEIQSDYLVVSLSAQLAPEQVPGLAEAGYNLYTLEGASAINAARGP